MGSHHQRSRNNYELPVNRKFQHLVDDNAGYEGRYSAELVVASIDGQVIAMYATIDRRSSLLYRRRRYYIPEFIDASGRSGDNMNHSMAELRMIHVPRDETALMRLCVLMR